MIYFRFIEKYPQIFFNFIQDHLHFLADVEIKNGNILAIVSKFYKNEKLFTLTTRIAEFIYCSLVRIMFQAKLLQLQFLKKSKIPGPPDLS